VKAQRVERSEDLRVVASQSAEDLDDVPVLPAGQRRRNVLTVPNDDRQDDRAGFLAVGTPHRAPDRLNDRHGTTVRVNERDPVDSRHIHSFSEQLDVRKHPEVLAGLLKLVQDAYPLAARHPATVDVLGPHRPDWPVLV
jgi:hypothetical protein